MCLGHNSRKREGPALGPRPPPSLQHHPGSSCRFSAEFWQPSYVFGREKIRPSAGTSRMMEGQRRMLGGSEDFSENLRDKHRRHWMVCGIICGKHTDGASVRIGCGCSFFLQNPLSPRWDECHADGILPRNGLAASTLWMAFRPFLHKRAQVISLISGGFLWTNVN